MQLTAAGIQILRSGSGGNAALIWAGETRLLIDAGLPAEVVARELAALGLALTQLTAILLTHEHDDHARGAGALARAAGIAVLANEATLRRAAPLLAAAQTETFATGQPFTIGPFLVEAFPVPHDAAEPVGFHVRFSGASSTQVVIACDLGEADGPLRERLPDADLIVLEANYDPRLLGVSGYPWFLKNRIISPTGHLSNEAAANAAVCAGRGGRPQRIVLTHLSEVNNLMPLARDTVRWALDREGMAATRVEAVRPNARSAVFAIP